LGRFAADLITQQHSVAHRTLEADALARILCGRPRDWLLKLTVPVRSTEIERGPPLVSLVNLLQRSYDTGVIRWPQGRRRLVGGLVSYGRKLPAFRIA
jgi:hypothetical protein